MPDNLPTATPWGQLIRLARDAAGLSIPAAARLAGVSRDNWGHIERGYQNLGAKRAPRSAPGNASTVARMADAVGITPERLEEAGRSDAAAVLREMDRRRQAAAEPTDAERFTEWVAAQLHQAGRTPDQIAAFLRAEHLPDHVDGLSVDFYRRLAAQLNRGLADVLVDAGAVTLSELGSADPNRRRVRSPTVRRA